MALATVDQEACRRDAFCVKVCPMGVLESDAQLYPRVGRGKDTLCIHCGHCVAVCESSAIAIDGIAAQDCLPLAASPLTREQVSEYFKARRSIRWYKDKPVPRELIAEVLDIARWAPTARNAQVVEWLVIDSPAQLRQLLQMVVDFLRPHPARARMVKAWDAGADLILRSAPALVIAHAPINSYNPTVDCSIALSHVELAACAFGLGACWAGVFMSAVAASAPLREALQLPKGSQLGGALMLGYPRVPYRRIPPRNALRVQWR